MKIKLVISADKGSVFSCTLTVGDCLDNDAMAKSL